MFSQFRLLAVLIGCAFVTTGCDVIDEEIVGDIIDRINERAGEQGDDSEEPEDEAAPEDEVEDVESPEDGELPEDGEEPELPPDGELPEPPIDDGIEGEDHHDPCAGNPEDPEEPGPACEEDPDAPLPADEDDLPEDCEAEDPCMVGFDACMEAVEDGEGAFEDEEWCMTDLDACIEEQGGIAPDICGGDEELPSPDEMCEEQLQFCLEGLDEESEEDQEFIQLCYEDVEMCKQWADEGLVEDPEGQDPCDAEFQACMDAQDLGENADEAQIDAAFEFCDEAFFECIGEALPEGDEAFPEDEDGADDPEALPVEPEEA